VALGSSLFLIAVGAILRWAIDRTTAGGVSLPTVGLILIIVGLTGLVISLWYMLLWSPRRGPGSVVRDRYVERDPRVDPRI
jgi:hypothetical protein